MSCDNLSRAPSSCRQSLTAHLTASCKVRLVFFLLYKWGNWGMGTGCDFLKPRLDLSLAALEPWVMFAFPGMEGHVSARGRCPRLSLSCQAPPAGHRTCRGYCLGSLELGVCLLILGCLCSNSPQWEEVPFLLHMILWGESHYLY